MKASRKRRQVPDRMRTTRHTAAAITRDIVRCATNGPRGKAAYLRRSERESDNGESGAPSPATSSKGFQIYIPLEQGEKNPSGGEAGKAAPKERKG